MVPRFRTNSLSPLCNTQFVPSTPFTQVPNDPKCCAYSYELSFPDATAFSISLPKPKNCPPPPIHVSRSTICVPSLCLHRRQDKYVHFRSRKKAHGLTAIAEIDDKRTEPNSFNGLNAGIALNERSVFLSSYCNWMETSASRGIVNGDEKWIEKE